MHAASSPADHSGPPCTVTSRTIPTTAPPVGVRASVAAMT